MNGSEHFFWFFSPLAAPIVFFWDPERGNPAGCCSREFGIKSEVNMCEEAACSACIIPPPSSGRTPGLHLWSCTDWEMLICRPARLPPCWPQFLCKGNVLVKRLRVFLRPKHQVYPDLPSGSDFSLREADCRRLPAPRRAQTRTWVALSQREMCEFEGDISAEKAPLPSGFLLLLFVSFILLLLEMQLFCSRLWFCALNHFTSPLPDSSCVYVKQHVLVFPAQFNELKVSLFNKSRQNFCPMRTGLAVIPLWFQQKGPQFRSILVWVCVT